MTVQLIKWYTFNKKKRLLDVSTKWNFRRFWKFHFFVIAIAFRFQGEPTVFLLEKEFSYIVISRSAGIGTVGLGLSVYILQGHANI